jgi:catechol 2,3-dioxygenase-like lactoylglutathione lyase family enzyme
MPPAHEIAHLAHVELRTPVPEKSLSFFTGYLGLTEAERARGQARGLKPIESFHTYGTPPVWEEPR